MVRLLRRLVLLACIVTIVSAAVASAAAVDVSGGTIDHFAANDPIPPPEPRLLITDVELSSDAIRSGTLPQFIALPLPPAFAIIKPETEDFRLCVGAGCTGGIPARSLTREDTDGDGVYEILAWYDPADFAALVQGDLNALAAAGAAPPPPPIDSAKPAPPPLDDARDAAPPSLPVDSVDAVPPLEDGAETIPAPETGAEIAPPDVGAEVAPAPELGAETAKPAPLVSAAPVVASRNYTFSVSGVVFGWTTPLVLDPPIPLVRP